MISGFEQTHPLEPAQKNRIQWGAAVGAGLLTGIIFLLVPRGTPWSALTFFSPVVLGRNVGSLGVAPAAAWGIHMVLSVIYGLIISRVVAGLKQTRAIITGGLLGLVLYIINFVLVSLWWPSLRGNEVSVVFTHLVFGLVAAGAYRGLLKRASEPAV